MKIIYNQKDNRSVLRGLAGYSLNCMLLQVRADVCVSIVKFIKNL